MLRRLQTIDLKVEDQCFLGCKSMRYTNKGIALNQSELCLFVLTRRLELPDAFEFNRHLLLNFASLVGGNLGKVLAI